MGFPLRVSTSGLLLSILILWVIFAGSSRTVHLVGAPALGPADPFQVGYGMHVAVAEHMHLIRAAGFTHVKAYLSWANSEPEKGRYQWHYSPFTGDAYNIATNAQRSGLKLIVRVDTPPDWAAAGSGNRPPDDLDDFADFMAGLARYLRGWVLAYEIYNEPNLSREWGGQPPDPERYAAMLKAVYPAIKSADPDALVISAGMATTAGDGGATSMNDLEFIRRMYLAGAKGYFDVLGSHPYAFGSAPQLERDDGTAGFFRPVQQRAVMLEFGDESPIWATEFGWPIHPGEFGRERHLAHPAWSGFEWQVVSQPDQAEYLRAAYVYARRNWPWMGVMVLFNLDFSAAPWYPEHEPMRFFSIVNEDLSGRPAYDSLREMEKWYRPSEER